MFSFGFSCAAVSDCRCYCWYCSAYVVNWKAKNEIFATLLPNRSIINVNAKKEYMWKINKKKKQNTNRRRDKKEKSKLFPVCCWCKMFKFFLVVLCTVYTYIVSENSMIYWVYCAVTLFFSRRQNNSHLFRTTLKHLETIFLLLLFAIFSRWKNVKNLQ